MIDHRAPSALRQPPLCRRLLTGAVRAALAIQLAALATLAPTGARAQTWTGAASSAFGNAANWSTNAVPDSTHEANFVGGTPSAVSLANSQVSVAGLNFAANAPAFTLTLSSTGPIGQTLAIGAAGIVNLSPATQHIVAANANTAISLSGTNATNSGTVELDASATLAAINFAAGASAGSATIVTTSGAKTTFSGASAGHATISVIGQSGLSFFNGADAGNATIANGALATTAFNDTSGAANAHISNAGELLFAGSASAQSAVIDSSGTVLFANASSAALSNSCSACAARSLAARTSFLKPRAKTLRLTASSIAARVAVIQIPRPGNLRLMSGTASP